MASGMMPGGMQPARVSRTPSMRGAEIGGIWDANLRDGIKERTSFGSGMRSHSGTGYGNRTAQASVLAQLTEAQQHEIVSTYIQENDPVEWRRILDASVWRNGFLHMRLTSGSTLEIPREPLKTALDVKVAVLHSTGLQWGSRRLRLSKAVPGGVKAIDDAALVATLPESLYVAVYAIPHFQSPPPQPCVISDDGLTVRCIAGPTAQWEAIFGDIESNGDLEFAIHLDRLQGNGTQNNICVGVAPADFTPSIGGSWLNANSVSVAFGLGLFPPNAVKGKTCSCNGGCRWNQGDIVRVVAHSSAGQVDFFWDGELRASWSGTPLACPVRPVVFMRHQGDQVSFVDVWS